MTVPPSGRHYEITLGDQRAAIVEVGGAIRCYEVDGVDVLDPFPVDAIADGARGLPLVPWPNRLGDGRYTWDGVTHQLPLTEPAQGNAIHGLLAWRPWDCATQESSQLTMQARLLPSPGYPFSLLVEVRYALSATGLTVQTTATNVGQDPCPYGVGHHPYLSAGGVLDDCAVTVRASTRLLTDDRQLPVDEVPVAGTPFDLSDGPRFGDRRIDHAFAALDRDSDGMSRVRIDRADGHRAELWMDETYRFLQLYSGDTLALGRRRRGLAVEPMTCPPDAFRTGVGVLRLGPGEISTATWGVVANLAN